jgi:predicted  nucleic acid-binding Zn-ribbon protein
MKECIDCGMIINDNNKRIGNNCEFCYKRYIDAILKKLKKERIK